MASVAELKDALRETLGASGVVDELRARVRAEVFSALDDRTGTRAPALSDENLVINELIREYLSFNGYRSSLSVFMPESGQPAVSDLNRDFLAQQLGLPRDEPHAARLPLLYSLVSRASPPKPAPEPPTPSERSFDR